MYWLNLIAQLLSIIFEALAELFIIVFFFLDLIYINCIFDRGDGGSKSNFGLDYPCSLCS